MRTAEVETVQYRTEEILCASNDLFRGYAKYSGIEGTELLPDVASALDTTIIEQLSDQITWRTPGLTFVFSGFPPPLLRIAGDELELSASAPYFAIKEGYDPNLSPALRGFVSRVANVLVSDLEYEHQVDVDRDDNLVIIKFSKKRHAKNINRIKVPIIEPAT